ncbi:hypothetical protein [Embleya sp. NPDC001921]
MDEAEPFRAELMDTSGLKPIPARVSPQGRALAVDLRALFAVLGVSVRVYALRTYMDAGALSRYLNGTRIAPAEFVERLLRDVEVKAGPRTAEATARVRAAQRAALAVSNPVQARLQEMRDDLAEADRRLQESQVREQALAEVLQARQRDLADLIGRHRELQVAAEGERADHAEGLESAREEQRRLREERDRLARQVQALREALGKAHHRTLDAERRCEELERRLDTAEIHAADAQPDEEEGKDDPPTATESPTRPALATGATRETSQARVPHAPHAPRRPTARIPAAPVPARIASGTLRRYLRALREAGHDADAERFLVSVARDTPQSRGWVGDLVTDLAKTDPVDAGILGILSEGALEDRALAAIGRGAEPDEIVRVLEAKDRIAPGDTRTESLFEGVAARGYVDFVHGRRWAGALVVATACAIIAGTLGHRTPYVVAFVAVCSMAALFGCVALLTMYTSAAQHSMGSLRTPVDVVEALHRAGRTEDTVKVLRHPGISMRQERRSLRRQLRNQGLAHLAHHLYRRPKRRPVLPAVWCPPPGYRRHAESPMTVDQYVDEGGGFAMVAPLALAAPWLAVMVFGLPSLWALAATAAIAAPPLLLWAWSKPTPGTDRTWWYGFPSQARARHHDHGDYDLFTRPAPPAGSSGKEIVPWTPPPGHVGPHPTGRHEDSVAYLIRTTGRFRLLPTPTARLRHDRSRTATPSTSTSK